ncbi:MAG: formimidoylglutamate deiminase [Phycisphaerales bacterium]|nr:formimidoylglutamate deiminase [Phycisphaerales bacterium]
MTIIRPELAWIGGDFLDGVEVHIEHGHIASVVPTQEPPTHEGMALIPGFVNAHSHAFQLALRGRGEVFPTDAESFWTWREAMYDLVESLSPDDVGEIAWRCFMEMRGVGITSVGEFHYLHHADPAARDFAMDAAVLEAAHMAGIRITLLQAAYVHGGFGEPLAGGQMRFDTKDYFTWEDSVDAARRAGVDDKQSVGAVIHSLRAVDIEHAKSIRAYARDNGLVVHAHLEEQVAEIEACVAATGKRPMQLVNEHLEPGPDMTMVHCTHTAAEDMSLYGAAGGRVCLCPMTEANLGDGLADVQAMLGSGADVCLGTDSNARISMLEEMRMAELGQRLRVQRRGVCLDADGRVDRPLMDMATVHGAASLGLHAGAIMPGTVADLALVDLDCAWLASVDQSDLGAALVLSGSDDLIMDSCVGGAWLSDLCEEAI